MGAFMLNGGKLHCLDTFRANALLESEADPARVRRAVQHVLALTRANLEEARRSLMDLRAAPLQNRSLVEALAALADGMAVAGKIRPLPRRVETGIYRIVQESLSNLGRHAQASQAAIELTFAPAEIVLVIQDDGVGFEPDQVPPNRFGLIGMNERIKLLVGQLRLESAPEKGTRIEDRIPA